MGKSFQTINSSLFSKDNLSILPDWIDKIDYTPKEGEKLPLEFEKKAAFNTALKVSRDTVNDYSTKSISHKLNNNQMELIAKTELAKFLTGKYYNIESSKINNNQIELKASLTNVPATFFFKYAFKQGRAVANSLFSINVKEGDGEYPFNKAGFNECLEDIKHNRVKTGEKAKAYKAYTVTLEEVVRRFNGDQRAAMDRVRELLASQDIIGVESNTFATVYAIDSLFPKMKKEGGISTPSAFEFVNNQEHVAAKSNSSAAKLIIDASKKLHELFDDFKILSFERNNNFQNVTADILLNNKMSKVAFNFNIVDDKVTDLAFISANNQIMSLDEFKKLQKSNVLQAYEKNNNKQKRIIGKTVLTKEKIINQLEGFINKDIINDIIDNWLERKLIEQINSHTYATNKSFNELLDSINTKLLTSDEINNIKEFKKKVTANLNRIEQEDTGIRNEIIYSKSIRLANVYNKLSLLDKFVINNINNDCSEIDITNYSERGPEKLKILAQFEGNKCIKASIKAKKNVTAALKNYKKLNKKNIYSKSVFSLSMLKKACESVFKDPNQAVKLAQQYMTDIGNNFYASQYPLSAIINQINLPALTNEERKEYLHQAIQNNNTLTASYLEDTGIRSNIDYSKSIRLASVYNLLSQKLNNFSLLNSNDDCSKINIEVKDEQGIKQLQVFASFDKENINQCTNIKLPKEINDSSALTLYKQANKHNIFAKSIFSRRMLANVLGNIFKDSEKAINMVLTKIATKIGRDYYASKYPLSVIIQNLSKYCSIYTEKELKELNELKSYFTGKKVTASYEKDSGIRTDIFHSKTIRLANAYKFLSKQYKKFFLDKINDNVTLIDIKESTPVGLVKRSFKVDYDINNPIKMASVNNEKIAVNNLVKAYDKIHTQKETNKIVFSKLMLKQALKNLAANTDEVINKICDKSIKLGNDYFANEKPLSQLLNEENIDLDINYEPKVDNQIYRNEGLKDDVRNIELTDNLINMTNKAIKYLSQHFKNFSTIKINPSKGNSLDYNILLFNEQQGINTQLHLTFYFDKNGEIEGCYVNVNNQSHPISMVKKAFATNEMLSTYLKYDNGTKTNSPIIISTNHFIEKLKNITKASKEELKETLATWEKQFRIKKIAKNAYASDYTLEQLLALSSLKPLTNEEIKHKLLRKKNWYKVSSAYVKDTGDRQISNEWNLDQFIKFARSEINKLYKQAEILDANLDENNFSIKARVSDCGIYPVYQFIWALKDNKPFSFKLIKSEINPNIKIYNDRNNIDYSNKFIIKKENLINKLLGIIDKATVNKACEQFIDEGILQKIDNNKYASNCSIQELINKMKTNNLSQANKELKQAALQDEIDTTKYNLQDQSRELINKRLTPYMQQVSERLKNNIILAANNKLITERKKNVWIDLLKQAKDNSNIEKVYKEFSLYLKEN